jgi:hypothetical protein
MVFEEKYPLDRRFPVPPYIDAVIHNSKWDSSGTPAAAV